MSDTVERAHYQDQAADLVASASVTIEADLQGPDALEALRRVPSGLKLNAE